MDPKYVKRRYFNPRQPGSLSGLSGFFANSKYQEKKQVENVLQSLYSYNIHKPARKRFKRYPLMCPFKDYMWQADLLFYDKFKHSNNNYAYILLCVDCLSRFIMCEPLKKKTAEEVQAAFQRIFKRHKRQPTMLHTDRGGEFFGSILQSFLKTNGIKSYSTFSPMKAMLSERMIRTLKTRLERYFTHTKQKRWIDVLQDVVDSINHSVNSTTKFKPADVKKSNEGEVWMNLYHKYITGGAQEPKYRVGDFVKVAKTKLVFEKGYTANYSKETFIIKRIIQNQPVVLYILSDQEGNDIEGNYQEKELIKVNEINNED